MSNLKTRIDARIIDGSLLTHPFYKSWSAGELSRDALAGYAAEYFELVKAVPELLERVLEVAPASMRDELIEHRDEEAQHLEPWRGFARALDVDEARLAAHETLPETREAVAGMHEAVSGPFVEAAAAMYALELEIPKIAHTKMDGLARFYGIADDEATEYFRLHTEADVRHAATWRDVLERATPPDEERIMSAIDRSLAAQHRLLDGCVRVYC